VIGLSKEYASPWARHNLVWPALRPKRLLLVVLMERWGFFFSLPFRAS
jgi:hypothetical protein